ncbi:hypothetical protein MLD38_008728 [Melastoma candidum]|uniref:Uncharacterized protein n=1 Tax=Melastoma candidum TaxID=119954 RepID=A0ACB9RUQ8_9MYRT|nr:hypothetical protein MLD38_008728 [Melastoma candidum]
MKAITAADHLKSPSIIKTTASISLSFLFFLLGKNFSHSSSYQRLLFFSSNSASPFSSSFHPVQSHTVVLSPNLNVTFDPALISNHTGDGGGHEAIKRLKSTEKGEKFERHCPEAGKGLDCLVPAPKGYRPPVPWPRSRDKVWFSNVSHTRLVEDKGGQNWITQVKDKFKSPGDVDQISEVAAKQFALK